MRSRHQEACRAKEAIASLVRSLSSSESILVGDSLDPLALNAMERHPQQGVRRILAAQSVSEE